LLNGGRSFVLYASIPIRRIIRWNYYGLRLSDLSFFCGNIYWCIIGRRGRGFFTRYDFCRSFFRRWRCGFCCLAFGRSRIDCRWFFRCRWFALIWGCFDRVIF